MKIAGAFNIIRLTGNNNRLVRDIIVWGKPKEYTISDYRNIQNGLHRYRHITLMGYFSVTPGHIDEYLYGQAIEINGKRFSIGTMRCFDSVKGDCDKTIGINHKMQGSRIIKLRSDFCLNGIIIPFAKANENFHFFIDLLKLEDQGLIKDFTNNCTTVNRVLNVNMKCILHYILIDSFTYEVLMQCLRFTNASNDFLKAPVHEALNLMYVGHEFVPGNMIF